MKTLPQNTTFRNMLMAVIVLSGMILISCEGPDMPVIPSIDVDLEELLFATPGGTQTIEITSDKDWEITAIPGTGELSWCEVSPMEGPAGKSDVQFTVSPSSDDANARVARYQLRTGASGYVITVIQSGIPIVITGDVLAKDEATAIITSSWLFALDIDLAERGIAYRTFGSEGAFTHIHSGGLEKGSFQTTIESLAPITKYEYKAYVKTEEGINYYGELKDFTSDGVSVLTSVAALRARFSGEPVVIGEFEKISGVVVTDTLNGNAFPSHVCVVDGSSEHSGITIGITGLQQLPYNAGDRLEIKLAGSTLSKNATEPVLSLMVHPLKVKKTASGQSVSPVKIAHTDLGSYESMYVEIENTQITFPYTDPAKYPSWNGDGHPYQNTTYVFEVEGSEDIYGLFVNAAADFAPETVKTGSGSLKGISSVSSDGTIPIIRPRNAGELSLTNNRFQSLLVLKFVSVRFFGSMMDGVENGNDCMIRVYYQNAYNEIISGPVSIAISGDAGVGLSIEPMSDIQLGEGSGYLQFAVTGAPAEMGDVTFTVEGLEEYGLTESLAQTTGTVLSSIPLGNFSAVWGPFGDYSTGDGGNPPLAVETNSHSGTIDVSAVSATGMIPTPSGHYRSVWGGAVEDAAEVSFTVTNNGTTPLLLYSLVVNVRSSTSSTQVPVTFRIGNGSPVTLTTFTGTTSSNVILNLSKYPELQNLTTGTTVTFTMHVPAVAKWGIRALSMTGNVN